MRKAELLEALQDTRNETTEMLENLPDELMLEPGVLGELIRDAPASSRQEGPKRLLPLRCRRNQRQKIGPAGLSDGCLHRVSMAHLLPGAHLDGAAASAAGGQSGGLAECLLGRARA